MNNLEVWILTFNRPEALDRLTNHFGEQGFRVNIFSDEPKLKLPKETREKYVDKIVFNTLNSSESNSWCARAWNNIMMKAFDNNYVEGAILVQDDTDIRPGFRSWFEDRSNTYDFIWGPAGDQFFFLTKQVLQRVGWFDERYIGCYCGDADFVKRVYMDYPGRDRISISDTHNWGFIHNECGIQTAINTEYNSKVIANYENQHERIERITTKANPTIRASQQHFMSKWGVPLDNNRPVIEHTTRMMNEIDWYPWFSKKHHFSYFWEPTHEGL